MIVVPSLLRRILDKYRFRSSQSYWEARYALGGTSGAGSYGRLALHKADVINSFITQHDIGSVIEFGYGDGNQLSLLRCPHYLGVDVSPTAVETCRQRFAGDTTREFWLASEWREQRQEKGKADLSLSLDVIYHLIEDEVFAAYMQDLFGASRRFVIVYSSNSDEPSLAAHVRHRKFADWVQDNVTGWHLVDVRKNPYPIDPASPETTSFADWYTFARSSDSAR